MSTADARAEAQLRRLRAVQLALVAALVAVPALQLAAIVVGQFASFASSLGWLCGAVLTAAFIVIAHGLAARLGPPLPTSAAHLVIFTLIPCVSVIGLPYALYQLARAYAPLAHDDGLVQRTTIAAVLYPAISFGGGILGSAALVALFAAGEGQTDHHELLLAVAVTAPSLLAQGALAAATYFLTTAAAAAVDLRRDLPSTGAGGPAAISV